MNSAHERRAPGTARMPFDAMVEVGGALGPSFEAQAVNLSEEGMSLRTAYLPEVGQPVMCRFDASGGQGAQGMTVVAAGEVLWKDDMGDGGEFGIRFTNLDGQSTVALQRVLGMAADGQMAPQQMPADPHGRKVRLHIEGLASPMRARIKAQADTGVTAYSELGFLQMGKPLELEDAASGNRRPASIDRVEVEINGESLVPQLVVSLRYDDMPQHEGMMMAPADDDEQRQQQQQQHDDEIVPGEEHDEEAAPLPAPHGHSHGSLSGEHEAPAVEVKMAHDGSGDENDEESHKLKSAFARNAAKVTPALMAWAKRAKIAAALLAAKARRGRGTGDDVEIPLRRTTAPAPGGGLHTAGRKVVRGSVPDDGGRGFEDDAQKANGANKNDSRFKMITKKRIAIASTVGIALVLIFIAMRKPSPAPQLASAPPGVDSNGAMTMPAAAINGSPNGGGKPTPPPNDPLAAAAAAMNGGGGNGGAPGHKGGKAIPFTNGPVGSHPNVIKIKMDGYVDGIQGATQPTGFTIVTPNRRSMDPTNMLGDKDPRFAMVNVSNEAGGAEFNVTFKDGVPNYLVRAHGDTLEIVLASENKHEKSEAKSGGGGKKRKAGKKH